jgi:hypothetical protein
VTQTFKDPDLKLPLNIVTPNHEAGALSSNRSRTKITHDLYNDAIARKKKHEQRQKQEE